LYPLPAAPASHTSTTYDDRAAAISTLAQKKILHGKNRHLCRCGPSRFVLWKRLTRRQNMGTLILKVLAGCRALGPYLLIELFLPGGSLIAILLWLYRSSRSGSTSAIGSGGRIGGCKLRTAPDVS
jgi:hypothetical protein